MIWIVSLLATAQLDANDCISDRHSLSLLQSCAIEHKGAGLPLPVINCRI